MKNKKLLIIGIILLIILALTAKIALDFHKEKQIRNEIKEVTKLFGTSNIDDESAKEMLERRIIDKGDYKVVEDSIKRYYKDLYSNLNNINFLLDEENEFNYLSSTNITSDMPSFTKSKDTIKNTRAQTEEYYNLFIKYLTDEEIKLGYISDSKVRKYYVDFYLELTNEVNDENLKESLLAKYNSVNNKLDIYEEALTFLENNSEHWKIKDDNIAFDTTEIYDEYILITNKLTEVSN